MLSMAQERQAALDVLDVLERERTQALRDAQARTVPQWSGAAARAWLPPVADESPCFAVQRLEWRVAPPPGFADLLNEFGDFTQACLGPLSLDALRRNLDARLLALGYATSSVDFLAAELAG